MPVSSLEAWMVVERAAWLATIAARRSLQRDSCSNQEASVQTEISRAKLLVDRAGALLRTAMDDLTERICIESWLRDPPRHSTVAATRDSGKWTDKNLEERPQ